MSGVMYVDVYFLLNFAMVLVALSAASFITSEKTGWRRLLTASLVGALFALIPFFLSTGFLLTVLLGFSGYVGSVWIAFGNRRKRRFFLPALFTLVTALVLGGALEALSYYMSFLKDGIRLTFGVFLALLFFVFGFFSLWGKGLKRKMETLVVSISISVCGKEEVFYALVDSGSLLRDPEKGRPVILLKAAFAGDLLGQTKLCELRRGEGEKSVAIPIRTASGQGELYAFMPDDVRIHGKRRKKQRVKEDILIALDFSEGGFAGCPCLVPLSVL